MCSKNYQDYLYVNEDQVMEAGFEPKNPQYSGGTTYYTSDTCEYALAEVSYYGWVLIDRETYETIKDINISMNSRENGRFYIPFVEKGNNLSLHRNVMNANKKVPVDHISHNPYCCIKENLRLCNRKQNSLNSRRRCRVKNCKSRVEGCLAYRESARALYKGTEKENFVYDIENDFSETLGLLLHYYIIGDITKEEMYQMNLDYWRHRLK